MTRVPLDTSIGDLMPVEAFRAACKEHFFIDYDGYGYPVFGDMMDSSTLIRPSRLEAIPADATHILWFNR